MKKFTINTIQEFKDQRRMKTIDFWHLSCTAKRKAKFTPLIHVHVQWLEADAWVDYDVRQRVAKECHKLFSYLETNNLRYVVYARNDYEISFLMRDQAEAALFKLAMA
jgi:hypothetical protein